MFQHVGLAAQQLTRATGNLPDPAARGGNDDTCALVVRDLDNARTLERQQYPAHRCRSTPQNASGAPGASPAITLTATMLSALARLASTVATGHDDAPQRRTLQQAPSG